MPTPHPITLRMAEEWPDAPPVPTDGADHNTKPYPLNSTGHFFTDRVTAEPTELAISLDTFRQLFLNDESGFGLRAHKFIHTNDMFTEPAWTPCGPSGRVLCKTIDYSVNIPKTPMIPDVLHITQHTVLYDLGPQEGFRLWIKNKPQNGPCHADYEANILVTIKPIFDESATVVDSMSEQDLQLADAATANADADADAESDSDDGGVPSPSPSGTSTPRHAPLARGGPLASTIDDYPLQADSPVDHLFRHAAGPRLLGADHHHSSESDGLSEPESPTGLATPTASAGSLALAPAPALDSAAPTSLLQLSFRKHPGRDHAEGLSEVPRPVFPGLFHLAASPARTGTHTPARVAPPAKKPAPVAVPRAGRVSVSVRAQVDNYHSFFLWSTIRPHAISAYQFFYKWWIPLLVEVTQEHLAPPAPVVAAPAAAPATPRPVGKLSLSGVRGVSSSPARLSQPYPAPASSAAARGMSGAGTTGGTLLNAKKTLQRLVPKTMEAARRLTAELDSSSGSSSSSTARGVAGGPIGDLTGGEDSRNQDRPIHALEHFKLPPPGQRLAPAVAINKEPVTAAVIVPAPAPVPETPVASGGWGVGSLLKSVASGAWSVAGYLLPSVFGAADSTSAAPGPADPRPGLSRSGSVDSLAGVPRGMSTTAGDPAAASVWLLVEWLLLQVPLLSMFLRSGGFLSGAHDGRVSPQPSPLLRGRAMNRLDVAGAPGPGVHHWSTQHHHHRGLHPAGGGGGGQLASTPGGGGHRLNGTGILTRSESMSSLARASAAAPGTGRHGASGGPPPVAATASPFASALVLSALLGTTALLISWVSSGAVATVVAVAAP
ncbi:hypothetical protein H696_01234 [Fonticula alba]|uniref:VASt domain-containing protein n=1 Tax=Fonticula alba TaxID=691883 RepID=A0A058ZD01_FONAL|nr:hypothetical protein H696_01234 [Fonticula alba]KCV71816.1 hypothetical protein H696_01234 [Fonticula alba]|eukprot:XP_009493394.1 hypothetical protein H696_01234 [Fonticula alba]